MSVIPTRRVLVVEDETDLRHLYSLWLRMAGHDVYEAEDGLAALRLLDSGINPDVIVLDLMLPGLSGVSVRREIASHVETINTPVVVVTGSRAVASSLKAAAILHKPIASGPLLVAVEHACVPMS